jgi:ankyrin repeat protein
MPLPQQQQLLVLLLVLLGPPTASQEERIAVGRALLAAGAQLEARDAQGDTPLMTAFRQEEWAPAAWLLGE